jgi:hypothetical protein
VGGGGILSVCKPSTDKPESIIIIIITAPTPESDSDSASDSDFRAMVQTLIVTAPQIQDASHHEYRVVLRCQPGVTHM